MGLFENPLGHAGYPPGVTGTPSTQPSAVRAATAAEATAGILNSVYLSPATAAEAASASFASPPALGSTTPNTVNATGLQVTEGANAKQGVVTLVGGTATVANTSVTANSRIFLTAQNLGTVTAPSALCVINPFPGVGFTILASQATDTSIVAYEIFEPA